MRVRGATSIEYLFIVAIALSAFVAIAAISMNSGSDSVRIAQAKDSVEKLAKSADYVSSLGPGSRETFTIILPEGIDDVEFRGNTVHLNVSLSTGVTDFFSKTSNPVFGDVNVKSVSGLQTVVVTALPNGSMFGDPLISCNPDKLILTVPNSYVSGKIPINVTNLATGPLYNLSANLSTINPVYLTTNGQINVSASPFNLPNSLSNGSSLVVNLTMNTTNDASGAYMGALNVAGNGSFCTTQIFVNVVNNNGGGGSSSKNIAVLVDLGTTNLASAKSGAQDFIGLVSSDTYLGVIRYGVSTKKGGSSLENSGFLEMTGSNKASAQSFAGGSTGGQVVGDAIGYAANSMLPSSGNKAIVIFTDSVSFKNGLGEFAKVFCDPNDKTSCQKASNNVNAIRDSNISVFVVDYGDGSDTSIEKTYTYSTNGQYFDGTSTSMLQVYQSLWQ